MIVDHLEPKAVLLSFVAYQKMVDLLEDYQDSRKAEAFEEKEKKNIEWVSHEQIKKLVA